MKKKTIQQPSSTTDLYSYTSPNNSLATIIDKKTMEQVYHDLDNPSGGTASLDKLLEQIDCEIHS